MAASVAWVGGVGCGVGRVGGVGVGLAAKWLAVAEAWVGGSAAGGLGLFLAGGFAARGRRWNSSGHHRDERRGSDGVSPALLAVENGEASAVSRERTCSE